jgi:hypothetical protein
MQKTIGILAVLLAAQLVLAVSLSFTAPDLSAAKPDTPLFDLGARSVERLTIEGTDQQRVVLARKDDHWVLPQMEGFPADQTRVDGLLDRLEGLKRGLPVATTEAAQKRFKVDDQTFERRIELAGSDDTLATLYFGSSPGMRRVHARSARDEAVYTVEFGLYDAPAKAEEWEDKALLQLQPDDIEQIGVAGLVLRPTHGEAPDGVAAQGDEPKHAAWSGAGLQPGETLDQAAGDALAEKLTGLRIGAVLGREPKPGYGLETPQLVLSIQRKAGETIEYRVGKREQEKDYVLKVSSRPEYFRLPAYTAEQLIEAASRDKLVLAAGAATEQAEAHQHGSDQPPAQGAEQQPQPAGGGEKAP